MFQVILRVAVGAVAATLLLAPAAVAAPPPNDNFADAQPLSGAPLTVIGSNVDATVEPEETFGAGRTVWYAWTAPTTGRFRVETCGSGFDTMLGVFTGATLATLTTVATDDDSCGFSSRVSVDAAAGTVYRIALGGYDDEQGTFRLTIAELHPPSNDDFDDAQPFAGSAVAGTTLDAGREDGEPFDHGDGSVWYTWTAPASGVFRIQTCGSASDAAPALYAGTDLESLTSRTPYPGDAWTCPGTRGRWVVARVAAGEALRIAVGAGETGELGGFTLRIGPEAVPANDAFAGAQVVAGPRWETDGVTIAATNEAGEPPHGGAPAARTVWLRWTAPANDHYFLAFAGNVRIGLYTGTALAGLTPVAVAGDVEEEGGLQFLGRGGTEYRIAVSWSEDEEFLTAGRFFLALFDGGMRFTPPALGFPAQPVGSISAPSVVRVRATAGAMASLPARVSVRGPDAADFLIAGETCGIEALECTVGVRFAPLAPGPRNAVLVVDPGFPGSYGIQLTGTGSLATPAPPPVTVQPIVPAASARCRLTRNNRRGGIVRCTVTRTPSADGTVTATVRRGTKTRARATARLRAGKATVQLKSRRKLAAGRYRVSLSVAVRGQPRLTVTQNVRVR